MEKQKGSLLFLGTGRGCSKLNCYIHTHHASCGQSPILQDTAAQFFIPIWGAAVTSTKIVDKNPDLGSQESRTGIDSPDGGFGNQWVVPQDLHLFLPLQVLIDTSCRRTLQYLIHRHTHPGRSLHDLVRTLPFVLMLIWSARFTKPGQVLRGCTDNSPVGCQFAGNHR